MFASKALAAALVVGAATVTAVAVPASNKMEHFREGRATIHQVARDNYRPNGALSMYRTYLKFGTPVPDWLETAVQASFARHAQQARRDEGSETTTPIDTYDDAYVTPVSIGTPAQVLNLDFDTGSSDLWVFSSLTSSSEVDGQASYNPDDSSTAELLSGYTWDISYGDGSSSSGVVYTDTVSVGGVTVASQAVEAAETVSTSFTSETAIDGLLGLGFDRLNTISPTSQSTFWSNALDALDEPVFCANLNHNAAGSYDFGFINSTFEDDLTYVSVTKLPGYWKFTSSGYGVGDDFTSTSITAIADTGTTLIYLPAAILSDYYGQVSGGTVSLTLFPTMSVMMLDRYADHARFCKFCFSDLSSTADGSSTAMLTSPTSPSALVTPSSPSPVNLSTT